MPASPILLLVPYRNKAAVLYSQIPTSASASGDMVVSRAGVSTRINAQGNIESVAANVPRLNYPLGGVANGCPALLVEPTATNALSYSEEFDNAAWAKSSMTVSTGTTALFTAPDGTTNADKIIATSGNAVHNISRTGIASAAYTFSVFAKAGEESVISLWLRGASVRAYFNLVSGTVSNITTTSARIENYGNGWYRCTIYDSTAGTTAHVYGRTGGTYAGNGSDGFYLWGAQLEANSVATSYIPTAASGVTRNADIVTNNTFVIPNLIGAILTEFDSPTSGTYFLDNIPIPIASGSNKIAISYTPTTLTIYRNGAQVSGSPVTPPGGTAPVIGNVINIGHNNQLYQLGSGIKSFVLYSSTLSAAEASGLTT